VEEKPAPELYVIKGPKPIVPPQGYRLPSDKERDKLGQMSSEIDRLRGLITAISGEQKKELIRMRRGLNADMIDFMEKHKIYYVPGGQMRKVKFVESVADDVKKELLLEGGPGSGHFGHKGRPGMRGGSLAGGAVRGHQMVRSSQMADWLKSEMVGQGKKFGPGEAVAVLRGKFPGQPESRYGRALLKSGVVIFQATRVQTGGYGLTPDRVEKILERKKVHISGTDAEKKFVYLMLSRVPEKHLADSGLKTITFMKSVDEITELANIRSGGRFKGKLDGFFDSDTGEMVVTFSGSASVFLHEFGHSLRKLKYKNERAVWIGNASLGSITRYGKLSSDEGFAEGYAMYVVDRGRLERKAPKIKKIYDKVFSA
jgi:hypothetical protein